MTAITDDAAHGDASRGRRREYFRAYRESNREKRREVNRRWREANREAIREYNRRYSEANRERERERARQWYEANPERKREYDRTYREGFRAAVLAHYGTECACCGSTGRLMIDHINGDGGQHRQELPAARSGGWVFYHWLIREGFPDGYQTLCGRCNTSKSDGPACRINHRRRHTS